MYSFMTNPQAFSRQGWDITLQWMESWRGWSHSVGCHYTRRSHEPHLAPGDHVLAMSKLTAHSLGKVQWHFDDDRGKQAQQLVQVWWSPVQLDVTMWCSVNLHNQLLLLCHYAWQGWGTAVASEPHLLSCLCVCCVSTLSQPHKFGVWMHPSGRHRWQRCHHQTEVSSSRVVFSLAGSLADKQDVTLAWRPSVAVCDVFTIYIMDLHCKKKKNIWRHLKWQW